MAGDLAVRPVREPDGHPEPVLSVVVPTYRGGHRIGPTVASVLEQDGSEHVELVIVDDGSDDDTPAVLEALARTDPRVRVLRRDNGGISAARNTGLAHARAPVVTFLDDDDRFLPGFVTTVTDAAGSAGDGAAGTLIFVGARVVDAASGRVHERRMPADLGPAFGHLPGVLAAGTLTASRRLLDDVGGYLEGLECSHQTELLLRLGVAAAEADVRVVTVERELVEIRRRAPGRRPESTPAKLWAGTERVLDRHRDRLAADPRLLADFHAVAGVAAARLGLGAPTRRHLVAAARTGRRGRDLARLVAGLGPWRRLVWGRVGTS